MEDCNNSLLVFYNVPYKKRRSIYIDVSIYNMYIL